MDNKLLISGNGKGNSAIFSWAVIYVISAIVFGVLFCSVIPGKIRSKIPDAPYSVMDFLPSARAERSNIAANINEYADGFFAIGVFGIIGFIIGAVLAGKGIAGTEIRVYENRIEGKSYGRIISSGKEIFQLAYDQITNVDVTDVKIVIHAANTKYVCYVSNSREIQNTIFNQRNLQKGSAG